MGSNDASHRSVAHEPNPIACCPTLPTLSSNHPEQPKIHLPVVAGRVTVKDSKIHQPPAIMKDVEVTARPGIEIPLLF